MLFLFLGEITVVLKPFDDKSTLNPRAVLGSFLLKPPSWFLPVAFYFSTTTDLLSLLDLLFLMPNALPEMSDLIWLG